MRLFLHALLVCAVNSFPQYADDAPKLVPSLDVPEGTAGTVAVSPEPGVSANEIGLSGIPSSGKNLAAPSDPTIESPLDTTAGSGDVLLAGTITSGDGIGEYTNGKDPLAALYNQCSPKRLACCQNWIINGYIRCKWFTRHAHWCEFMADWVCCEDIDWASSTGVECEPLVQPDPQPVGSGFHLEWPTWGGPGDSLQPGGVGIPLIDQIMDTVNGAN